MRIRIFLSLLLVFSVAPSLHARLVRSWTDQEIFEKADLIVIAKVISTENTNERSKLTDLSPPVNVTGVEADFETCLVLKGPKTITKFGSTIMRRRSRTLTVPGSSKSLETNIRPICCSWSRNPMADTHRRRVKLTPP